MKIYILMLMLLVMSFSISQPSFATNTTQCEVISAEDEKSLLQMMKSLIANN